MSNHAVKNLKMSLNLLKLSIQWSPSTNKIMFFVTFKGGKLVYLYTKKPGKVPRCGGCKTKLQGVSVLLKSLNEPTQVFS